ncbi:MAG: hypothetical protein ABSG76_10690 [Xanthobacteraceae bacterium]|jgi:hypothetical protein
MTISNANDIATPPARIAADVDNFARLHGWWWEFQIPLLVGALVRRGVKSVGTISWARPFPAHLPVTFNRMAT